MRRIGVYAFVLALLVGCGGRSGVADSDDPEAIIAKAIAAQGGEDKIASCSGGSWHAKGTMTVNGQTLPVTLATLYERPDRYKTDMEFEVQGKKVRVLQGLDGDKGWMSSEGRTQDLQGDLLKAVKEELFAVNAEDLVPLLKDESHKLTKLSQIMVNGRPAVGVGVSAKGHRDVELYFDKDTALPAKTVRPTIDANTFKETTLEVIYSDIRDFDGLKSPGKLVVLQEGKRYMDLEITDHKRLDKIDPEEFARPK
jgi:hypothetical protein